MGLFLRSRIGWAMYPPNTVIDTAPAPLKPGLHPPPEVASGTDRRHLLDAILIAAALPAPEHVAPATLSSMRAQRRMDPRRRRL